jgi:hypothetical protein
LVAAHFAADFSNNESGPLPAEKLADGSVKIVGPALGIMITFGCPSVDSSSLELSMVSLSGLSSKRIDRILISSPLSEPTGGGISSAQFEAGFSNNLGLDQSKFVLTNSELADPVLSFNFSTAARARRSAANRLADELGFRGKVFEPTAPLTSAAVPTLMEGPRLEARVAAFSCASRARKLLSEISSSIPSSIS